MSGEDGECIASDVSNKVDEGVAETHPSNLKVQRYSISHALKFALSVGHSKCEIKYVFLDFSFTQSMMISYLTVKWIYFELNLLLQIW